MQGPLNPELAFANTKTFESDLDALLGLPDRSCDVSGSGSPGLTMVSSAYASQEGRFTRMEEGGREDQRQDSPQNRMLLAVSTVVDTAPSTSFTDRDNPPVKTDSTRDGGQPKYSLQANNSDDSDYDAIPTYHCLDDDSLLSEFLFGDPDIHGTTSASGNKEGRAKDKRQSHDASRSNEPTPERKRRYRERRRTHQNHYRSPEFNDCGSNVSRQVSQSISSRSFKMSRRKTESASKHETRESVGSRKRLSRSVEKAEARKKRRTSACRYILEMERAEKRDRDSKWKMERKKYRPHVYSKLVWKEINSLGLSTHSCDDLRRAVDPQRRRQQLPTRSASVTGCCPGLSRQWCGGRLTTLLQGRFKIIRRSQERMARYVLMDASPGNAFLTRWIQYMKVRPAKPKGLGFLRTFERFGKDFKELVDLKPLSYLNGKLWYAINAKDLTFPPIDKPSYSRGSGKTEGEVMDRHRLVRHVLQYMEVLQSYPDLYWQPLPSLLPKGGGEVKAEDSNQIWSDESVERGYLSQGRTVRGQMNRSARYFLRHSYYSFKDLLKYYIKGFCMSSTTEDDPTKMRFPNQRHNYMNEGNSASISKSRFLHSRRSYCRRIELMRNGSRSFVNENGPLSRSSNFRNRRKDSSNGRQLDRSPCKTRSGPGVSHMAYHSDGALHKGRERERSDSDGGQLNSGDFLAPEPDCSPPSQNTLKLPVTSPIAEDLAGGALMTNQDNESFRLEPTCLGNETILPLESKVYQTPKPLELIRGLTATSQSLYADLPRHVLSSCCGKDPRLAMAKQAFSHAEGKLVKSSDITDMTINSELLDLGDTFKVGNIWERGESSGETETNDSRPNAFSLNSKTEQVKIRQKYYHSIDDNYKAVMKTEQTKSLTEIAPIDANCALTSSLSKDTHASLLRCDVTPQAVFPVLTLEPDANQEQNRVRPKPEPSVVKTAQGPTCTAPAASSQAVTRSSRGPLRLSHPAVAARLSKQHTLEILDELCAVVRPVSPLQLLEENWGRDRVTTAAMTATTTVTTSVWGCSQTASSESPSSNSSSEQKALCHDSGRLDVLATCGDVQHMQRVGTCSVSVPCAGAIQYEVCGLTVLQLFGTPHGLELQARPWNDSAHLKGSDHCMDTPHGVLPLKVQCLEKKTSRTQLEEPLSENHHLLSDVSNKKSILSLECGKEKRKQGLEMRQEFSISNQSKQICNDDCGEKMKVLKMQHSPKLQGTNDLFPEIQINGDGLSAATEETVIHGALQDFPLPSVDISGLGDSLTCHDLVRGDSVFDAYQPSNTDAIYLTNYSHEGNNSKHFKLNNPPEPPTASEKCATNNRDQQTHVANREHGRCSVAMTGDHTKLCRSMGQFTANSTPACRPSRDANNNHGEGAAVEGQAQLREQNDGVTDPCVWTRSEPNFLCDDMNTPIVLCASDRVYHVSGATHGSGPSASPLGNTVFCKPDLHINAGSSSLNGIANHTASVALHASLFSNDSDLLALPEDPLASYKHRSEEIGQHQDFLSKAMDTAGLTDSKIESFLQSDLSVESFLMEQGSLPLEPFSSSEEPCSSNQGELMQGVADEFLSAIFDSFASGLEDHNDPGSATMPLNDSFDSVTGSSVPPILLDTCPRICTNTDARIFNLKQTSITTSDDEIVRSDFNPTAQACSLSNGFTDNVEAISSFQETYPAQSWPFCDFLNTPISVTSLNSLDTNTNEMQECDTHLDQLLDVSLLAPQAYARSKETVTTMDSMRGHFLRQDHTLELNAHHTEFLQYPLTDGAQASKRAIVDVNKSPVNNVDSAYEKLKDSNVDFPLRVEGFCSEVSEILDLVPLPANFLEDKEKEEEEEEEEGEKKDDEYDKKVENKTAKDQGQKQETSSKCDYLKTMPCQSACPPTSHHQRRRELIRACVEKEVAPYVRRSLPPRAARPVTEGTAMALSSERRVAKARAVFEARNIIQFGEKKATRKGCTRKRGACRKDEKLEGTSDSVVQVGRKHSVPPYQNQVHRKEKPIARKTVSIDNKPKKLRSRRRNLPGKSQTNSVVMDQGSKRRKLELSQTSAELEVHKSGGLVDLDRPKALQNRFGKAPLSSKTSVICKPERDLVKEHTTREMSNAEAFAHQLQSCSPGFLKKLTRTPIDILAGPVSVNKIITRIHRPLSAARRKSLRTAALPPNGSCSPQASRMCTNTNSNNNSIVTGSVDDDTGSTHARASQAKYRLGVVQFRLDNVSGSEKDMCKTIERDSDMGEYFDFHCQFSDYKDKVLKRLNRYRTGNCRNFQDETRKRSYQKIVNENRAQNINEEVKWIKRSARYHTIDIGNDIEKRNKFDNKRRDTLCKIQRSVLCEKLFREDKFLYDWKKLNIPYNLQTSNLKDAYVDCNFINNDNRISDGDKRICHNVEHYNDDDNDNRSNISHNASIRKLKEIKDTWGVETETFPRIFTNCCNTNNNNSHNDDVGTEEDENVDDDDPVKQLGKRNAPRNGGHEESVNLPNALSAQGHPTQGELWRREQVITEELPRIGRNMENFNAARRKLRETNSRLVKIHGNQSLAGKPASAVLSGHSGSCGIISDGGAPAIRKAAVKSRAWGLAQINKRGVNMDSGGRLLGNNVSNNFPDPKNARETKGRRREARERQIANLSHPIRKNVSPAKTQTSLTSVLDNGSPSLRQNPGAGEAKSSTRNSKSNSHDLESSTQLIENGQKAITSNTKEPLKGYSDLKARKIRELSSVKESKNKPKKTLECDGSDLRDPSCAQRAADSSLTRFVQRLRSGYGEQLARGSQAKLNQLCSRYLQTLDARQSLQKTLLEGQKKSYTGGSISTILGDGGETPIIQEHREDFVGTTVQNNRGFCDSERFSRTKDSNDNMGRSRPGSSNIVDKKTSEGSPIPKATTQSRSKDISIVKHKSTATLCRRSESHIGAAAAARCASASQRKSVSALCSNVLSRRTPRVQSACQLRPELRESVERLTSRQYSPLARLQYDISTWETDAGRPFSLGKEQSNPGADPDARRHAVIRSTNYTSSVVRSAPRQTESWSRCQQVIEGSTVCTALAKPGVLSPRGGGTPVSGGEPTKTREEKINTFFGSLLDLISQKEREKSEKPKTSALPGSEAKTQTLGRVGSSDMGSLYRRMVNSVKAKRSSFTVDLDENLEIPPLSDFKDMAESPEALLNLPGLTPKPNTKSIKNLKPSLKDPSAPKAGKQQLPKEQELSDDISNNESSTDIRCSYPVLTKDIEASSLTKVKRVSFVTSPKISPVSSNKRLRDDLGAKTDTPSFLPRSDKGASYPLQPNTSKAQDAVEYPSILTDEASKRTQQWVKDTAEEQFTGALPSGVVNTAFRESSLVPAAFPHDFKPELFLDVEKVPAVSTASKALDSDSFGLGFCDDHGSCPDAGEDTEGRNGASNQGQRTAAEDISSFKESALKAAKEVNWIVAMAPHERSDPNTYEQFTAGQKENVLGCSGLSSVTLASPKNQSPLWTDSNQFRRSTIKAQKAEDSCTYSKTELLSEHGKGKARDQESFNTVSDGFERFSGYPNTSSNDTVDRSVHGTSRKGSINETVDGFDARSFDEGSKFKDGIDTAGGRHTFDHSGVISDHCHRSAVDDVGHVKTCVERSAVPIAGTAKRNELGSCSPTGHYEMTTLDTLERQAEQNFGAVYKNSVHLGRHPEDAAASLWLPCKRDRTGDHHSRVHESRGEAGGFAQHQAMLSHKEAHRPARKAKGSDLSSDAPERNSELIDGPKHTLASSHPHPWEGSGYFSSYAGTSVDPLVFGGPVDVGSEYTARENLNVSTLAGGSRAPGSSLLATRPGDAQAPDIPWDQMSPSSTSCSQLPLTALESSRRWQGFSYLAPIQEESEEDLL